MVRRIWCAAISQRLYAVAGELLVAPRPAAPIIAERVSAIAGRSRRMPAVRRQTKGRRYLNLGMILSAKWNVWINLRSMVWPISVTTLAD